MASIKTLLARAEKIDPAELVKIALEENIARIPDYNATQLAQGEYGDGTPIKATYAPFTVEIKKTKSGLAAVTSHITGYDTGDMYKNMYAKLNGSKVEYGSTSDHAVPFEKQYNLANHKVFGIGGEEKHEFVKNFLQKSLRNAAQRVTGLK